VPTNSSPKDENFNLSPKVKKVQQIYPFVTINKRAYVAQRDKNITKMIANMTAE